MVISFDRKPNDMQCYRIHYNFVTNIWIKYVRICGIYTVPVTLAPVFHALQNTISTFVIQLFFQLLCFFFSSFQNLLLSLIQCFHWEFIFLLYNKVYCKHRIICFSSFSSPFSSLQRNDKFPVFSCDANSSHIIWKCGNVLPKMEVCWNRVES